MVQCPNGTAVTLLPAASVATRPSVGTVPEPVPLVHTAVYGAAKPVVSAAATAAPDCGALEVSFTSTGRVYSGTVVDTVPPALTPRAPGAPVGSNRWRL